MYGLFNDAFTRPEYCDERRGTICKECRNERSLPDRKVLISQQQELDKTTKHLFQDSPYQSWDLKPGLKRSVMRSCTTLIAVARKPKREGKKELESSTLMKYIENGLLERSDIT
jgi:hypothetical protein